MNFLTAKELRDIADMVDKVNAIWDILVNHRGAVAYDADLGIKVYDSNGDTLGKIDWTEDGAAFYPSEEMNKE